MLFTTFLTLLVFSTYINSSSNTSLSNPQSGNISNSMVPIGILNRLGIISIIFILILFINSFNLLSIIPGITLYNNWFNITSYNIPLIIIILLLIILLLIYNTSITKYNINSPYLILLILSNIIGLILFPLVNDLLSLYIIIELQSYSLYLITGLHNRSYNASRGALLYFLMGGIASAIILLATYFIYQLTGTTNLSDITILINYLSDSNINNYFNILLIALLFKMGLAPLHRWSIAVYNYAPTYITAYISLVAKLSIISFIYVNSILFDNYILIIFFYLSLFIGAYKPLYQINIKIILAYSGILNFGYILLSIITNDISLYIYLLQYTLTHIIIFISILAASEYIDNPISKWSPLVYIHQLKLPNITLAICLILALFSLIGIPPLPGFYAKLYILSGAILDNYIIETIILVTCSVIATYYYANIIKILAQSINLRRDNISHIPRERGHEHKYINTTLSYIISSSTILMISLYIYLPYISEGLYLIIL